MTKQERTGWAGRIEKVPVPMPMEDPHGDAARIGLLALLTDIAIERDFARMVRDDSVAIVRLARFIDRIHDLDLNAPKHRHLKPPTINPGMISGGPSTPLTPPSAVCDIDIRLVPGLETDAVLAAFRAHAGPHVTVEMLDSKPPADTPDDDPFVQLCLGALKDTTGYAGGPECRWRQTVPWRMPPCRMPAVWLAVRSACWIAFRWASRICTMWRAR